MKRPVLFRNPKPTISMRLSTQILFAYGMDLLLGDPRWFPHPVRLMGWVIVRLERILRRLFVHEQLGGIVLATVIVALSVCAGWGVLRLAGVVHPWLGTVLSVVLFWTLFATRSLYDESVWVLRALEEGDLVEAREALSMIVGRDTESLDEEEIVRAVIETVGENLCDGVVAPLCYAALGGASLALGYKAASTLDSMVGYRTSRYKQFGWASAKLDDLLNFVPARLTGILICLAAFLMGMDGRRAWRVFLRNRRKHPSPNSAHGESALAGALGVQLGGRSSYRGIVSTKPHLGDQVVPLDQEAIRNAHRVLFATSVLALLLLLGVRAGFF